jgi:hypothetical protein
MLFLAVFGMSSCSRPPEYATIEARFIELVEASYDVNKLLFGEGLPTFKRVYEAIDEVYKTTDENGNTNYTYYHYIDDATYGKVLSYKIGATKVERNYLQVVQSPIDGRELIYADTETGELYYKLDGYTETKPEFYYTSDDPENYDYVRYDCGYIEINDIRAAAEKVYSKDYLETSVYVALFTGAVTNENLDGFVARYIDYGDDEGSVSLMMSNEYEPLITETRIFDFSTAKVVKPGSKKLVNIEVETYLPSNPENRVTVRVTMVLQDGQWYLDSGTY